MNETLIERQIAREEEQVSMGVERFNRKVEQTGIADSSAGRLAIKAVIKPVAEAIKKLVDEVENGKAGRGRPAIATQYLRLLEPEAAAFITARTALHAAMGHSKMTVTAMTLADRIEDQYVLDELKGSEPALLESMARKASKWTKAERRTHIMRTAAKVGGVSGLAWKPKHKLHLGMKLLELLITETGLVEQHKSYESKNNTPYILRPTETTNEWIKDINFRFALLSPMWLPMVAPPQPWESPVRGGYLTYSNRTDFVRTDSKEYRDELFNVDMPDVYHAVNAIQATPWKINKAVLEIMETLASEGSTLADLPPPDDLPLPALPTGVIKGEKTQQLTESQAEAMQEWKVEAAKTHEVNAQLISKRMSLSSKLSVARELAEEEAIYFPHNLDFRGRVYAMPTGIHPQADDQGKALIQFAEGKPLGDSGAYWLMVHIANLFGVDKISFDDRVQWTMDHMDEILDSAFDPLDGRRFWATADEPWQALAVSFELAGYAVEGEDYVSYIPVAMDGSCSGIQHFSAMLKDSEGGCAVNLLPAVEPQDIYTRVEEAADLALDDPGLSTNQLAKSWKGRITRKLVKRPCMTFAYSVTSRGMRDQILDEMQKADNGDGYLPGWTNYEAANFMAAVVEEAIRKTVKRAAEAMDWLKAAIKPVVAANRPVSWFTPTGLLVQHNYPKRNGQRIDVWFQGRRLQIQLRVGTNRQDLRKQTASIAPNFVHSMDAAHLMMVVNRLKRERISQDFAMIHDSFGVHAADVDELHYAIRDEFINLYSVDRLDEFREQLLEQLPDDFEGELPPTPPSGTLNLEDIREADFFFS